MKRLAACFWIILALGTACAANTEARLILSHESASPGETILAGVQLRMEPGWHTYWQNGGDSGAPTTIDWTLPKGVTAGGIQWPVPEKYVMEGETTFVYHNEVVLLVPITLAKDMPTGKLDLAAKVVWLECEKLCVRGIGNVTGALSVGPESKPSKDAALLDTWKTRLPQTKPGLDVRAGWEAAAKGDSRPLLIEWTATKETQSADFFPYGDEKFIVKAATEQLKSTRVRVRLRKSVEKLDAWPTEIAGVLIERDDSKKLLGAYEVKVPVQASFGATSAGSAAANSVNAPVEEQKPILVWLGIAFLGGLILNLMPCVLPVIALKIFGFVAQSHESPKHVRKLGIVYGLGVLCSFLVMAAAVIGLKSAGKQASWGMQFGSPYFLVGMTVLITLVALNFFGVFEVTLSGGAMDKASALASREGATGAFFNGVLTTVLATPCTAPFLAPALGFAYFAPPRTILLIFVTIALGLAAPYVLLSVQPGWIRFLPKPGPWMDTFKKAMGFPMLGTALFLLSLLDSHYGNEGVLWVGIFLVCVAVAAWLWGTFVQRSSRRRALALALIVVFLAGGYVFALEMQLDWRHRTTPTNGASAARKPGDIEWQPWSREAVEAARAEGRPVLVDFTATWCLNCRVNKRTSIEIPSVKQKLKEINAVALLGDYTHLPPAITEELEHFKRAGVPLVLVYPKDAAKSPIVLPELLSPSIVLDALEKAAN
jgi:thiol:disulfide interchange protein DsbD